MYKLAIHADNRMTAHHFAGLLSEAIHPAADAVSVFENGAQWRVEGYFTEHTVAETAAECVCSISTEARPDWAIEGVGAHNWVALSQAALPPVFAGRFTIHGSHDSIRVGRGPNRILIDAGEAFGTAHHATTYGCLVAIDRLTRRRYFKNILDFGTGSGVLALALRRAMPQARILATDADRTSIDVARTNARLNGDMSCAHGRLTFHTAKGMQAGAIRAAYPFDLIVANILAGPLAEMAGDISSALRIGGVLLLSGLLNEQAAGVRATYASYGLRLEQHIRMDNWSTLVMVRQR